MSSTTALTCSPGELEELEDIHQPASFHCNGLINHQTHFAQLLCMLMLAQGCLLNTSPPIHFNNSNSSGSQLSFVPNREAYRLNPYQMTTEALIAFAKCADLTSLAELLLEHRFYSNAGDLAVLCDMVAAVTQCCAAIVPAHILPCTSYLTAALKSTHQRHRNYFIHSR